MMEYVIWRLDDHHVWFLLAVQRFDLEPPHPEGVGVGLGRLTRQVTTVRGA
jgi:hypothetical protein